MSSLAGKVAVVTGASRGVGKGVAIGLGEAGATVYVTGRTMEPGDAVVPVPTSLRSTVEEVEAAGGVCVPVQLDQREDPEVEALFHQIEDEQGRLDVLVNSAWAGYENIHRMQGPDDYVFELPFWELPQSVCDDMLDVGVRSTYVASRLAAPLMVRSGGGLIAHVSSFAGELYLYNVAYGVSKRAVDRMASDMAHTFTGRAVAALAGDPMLMDRTGQVLVVAELALEYGFDDVDGKRPTSMRGRSWDGVA
jgi:dehydrogenase/reductase SDR family protein 1